MKVLALIEPSSTDVGAAEMGLPNVFKKRDIGGKTNVRKETQVIRSSGKDKKVYGRKTLAQKAT